MKITTLSRYEGALVGLAVGDAVGTTLEFKRPGRFEPITDMLGGGPFNLEPGQWTDDTSMALCLAKSLVECNGFDPNDQMNRYIRWYKEGYLSSNGQCFDIGITVSNALNLFQETGDPLLGSTNPNMAGNGSLMRLAPVPLYYAEDSIRAITFCAKSSQTTHGAKACIDACRYFGGLIVGALQDKTKEEILADSFSPIAELWESDPLCDEISEIAKGSFKDKSPPDIQGSGYVVKSLEAALWAFYQSNDFKQGCLMAANLGDDADTTAAIYGQIAGAYYGIDGIPISWRERIVFSTVIHNMASDLYETR